MKTIRLLLVLILVCTITGCGKKDETSTDTSEETQTEASSDSMIEVTPDSEDSSPSEVNSEETFEFEECSDSNVVEIEKQYYDYYGAKDVAGLNSLMLEPLPSDYFSDINYSAKYEILHVFDLGHDSNGDIAVGVEYDMWINDIKTPSRGLGSAVVRKTSAGVYYIDNSLDKTSEDIEFEENLKSDKRLKDLMARINRTYQEQINSDPELSAFWNN